MKVDTYNLCQPEIDNLSCFGCCGRDFKDKKSVLEQIEKNTIVFRKIIVPSTVNLLSFRDRYSANNWDVTNSGVCSNLVQFKSKKIACPLHKKINQLIDKKDFLAIHKKDLRWGHCDVNYECESIKLWKNLDIKTRQIFLEEIKKKYIDKKIDSYEYSTGLVSGRLLNEFLQNQKNIKK